MQVSKWELRPLTMCRVCRSRCTAILLKDNLTECKKQHEQLEGEIQTLLEKYHDDGKEPNPIAKSMSWVKTNMKMSMDPSDQNDVCGSDDRRMQYGRKSAQSVFESI